MSLENVEIVRAFWKAWLNGNTAPLSVSGGKVVYDHRRDPNGLFAQLDSAVEVHPPTGAMLEGVSYRGQEGMRQWFEDVAEYWESMWVEAYQFLDAEEAVVVLGRVHGRGKKEWSRDRSPGRLGFPSARHTPDLPTVLSRSLAGARICRPVGAGHSRRILTRPGRCCPFERSAGVS